jgi:putative ABC transport system permease protein
MRDLISFCKAFTGAWTWRMAWRDSRRSRRQLVLYSTSVVLGIAALIAVGSLGANLAQAIETQAKALLGADLVLASRDAPSGEVDAFFESLGGTQAREVSFSSMIYFPNSGRTRLVQIRGLEGAFPFYGTLETAPKEALAAFRAGTGALLDETLARQFAVKVGDPIKVGTPSFNVVGFLEKVPGETIGFAAIAPRVYIPLGQLSATGLLQRGSLVRYRVYFKFGPEVDVPLLVKRITPELERWHLDSDTVEHRKRDLGRAMTNLSHFLNLVGFVALLLGGIGIASAIYVHVNQKLPTVAILRFAGCSPGQALAIYVAQALAIASIGVTAGALLGWVIQASLPRVLHDFLPVHIEASLSAMAVARGAGIGFAVCFVFALLPLARVRLIPPLGVLRASVESSGRRRDDPVLWACYGLIAAGLFGFSIAQSQHWRFGAAFAGGIVAAFALLLGLAAALAYVLKGQVPRVGSFTWRQGLSNLYRPQNRTVLVMLSLGLGTCLILTLYLVQTNLVHQLLPTDAGERPDTVLFDIQSDQVDAVRRVLEGEHLPVIQQVPVVTMRLTAVKGRPVEQIRKEPGHPVPNWALRRESRSTYRDQLVDSEKLSAGTWHARAAEGTLPVPVSVEDGIAKTLNVGLGDELTFDVQGVSLRTVIASLREVDWRRLQPNFFVVFPQGVLEDAPAFHVLVTRVGSSEKSAELQRQVVQQFPNVSIIDLTLVLQTVDTIVKKISFVVRFMALFTVGTGLLVLAASILTGRYQRLQESILLRTLGASRWQIRQILAVEYFSLGSLAGFTGIILASAASWGLARFLFKISFTLPLLPLALALVIVVGITVLTGLLASRGICSAPPLEILRSES